MGRFSDLVQEPNQQIETPTKGRFADLAYEQPQPQQQEPLRTPSFIEKANIPLHAGLGVASGFQKAAASFAFDVQDIANIVRQSTGMKELKDNDSLINNIGNVLLKGADWTDRLNKESGANVVDDFVGQAIGGLGPGLAEWEAGTAFGGMQGAAQAKREGKSMAVGALKGAAKRFVLGKMLNALGAIKNPYIRRGAGAVTMGGVTAAEGGGLKDVATSAAMGGALTGYSGKSNAQILKEYEIGEMRKQKGMPVETSTIAQDATKQEKGTNVPPKSMYEQMAEKEQMETDLPPKTQFKQRLYKGVSKSGPIDEGIYGKGTYYTPKKEVAEGYAEDYGSGKGNVIEKDVTLNNPLKLSHKEIENFGNEVVINSKEFSSKEFSKMSNKEKMEFRANKITELAKSKGHDGIIITDKEGNPLEIVDFSEHKPSKIPDKPFKGKKNPDTSGVEYTGTINGKEVTIYRDTEQFGTSQWYTTEDFFGHKKDPLHGTGSIGSTKEEAIQYLTKKAKEAAESTLKSEPPKKDPSQLSPPTKQGETIKFAAVKDENGEVTTGQYHQDAYDKLGLNQEDAPQGFEEGFVTDKGRFVSREEASKISKKSGQLESPPKSLHSEDLGAEIKPPKRGILEGQALKDSISQYWEENPDSVELPLYLQQARAVEHLRKGSQPMEWPIKEPPGEISKEIADVSEGESIKDRLMSGQPPKEPPKAPPAAGEPAPEPQKPKSWWKSILPKWLGGEGKEPPKEKPIIEKEDIVKRVARALGKAKKVLPEITEEQTIERKKRVAIASKELEKGAKQIGEAEKSIRESVKALKGPLTEYADRFDSIRNQFKPQEIDSMFKRIADSKLQYFEKLNLQKALTKLLGDPDTGYAYALQRHEIILINKLFGKDLSDIAMGRRPMSDKVWDITLDVLGLPRTLLASVDMSGIMRQGRLLGHANPKEFWEMIKHYHKSFFSEEYTQKINKEIENSPDYEESLAAGLDLTRFGKDALDVLEREERFASKFAEKIPGVRQSERSYVSALNHFRLSVYSKLKQGIIESGQKVEPKQLRRISQLINDLTGRSSLSEGIKSRRLASVANALFFAPRFALSRFKAPTKMLSRDPLVRKQAAQAFSSFVATNLAIMGLVKLAGGDKVEIELDPRSSDFGKMVIGNVHIDPWAGFVPVVRFAAQFATGQRKTTTTHRIEDVKRLEVMTRFARTKLSPISSVGLDIALGKKYTGQQMNWFNANLNNEFYQRLTPLAIQDIVDVSVNDGWPAALAILPLTWYGIGIQDYTPTKYQQAQAVKEKTAMDKFGKQWDDLNATQQKALTISHKEITESERQAKSERTDYEFIGEMVQKEMEVGKQVEKSLPKDIQKEIIDTGTQIGGISRNLGKFKLNNQRYERYQQLLSERLNDWLPKRIKQSDWEGIPKQRKERILDTLITRAKESSRNRLMVEIRKETK